MKLINPYSGDVINSNHLQPDLYLKLYSELDVKLKDNAAKIMKGRTSLWGWYCLPIQIEKQLHCATICPLS